ncbi:MAG: hypothetical protein ABI624_14740 [Casimicrobiaceae bacterium]
MIFQIFPGTGTGNGSTLAPRAHVATLVRSAAAGLACAMLSAAAHAGFSLSTVTSDAQPVAGGSAFTYTILVSNASPAVPDMTVTDQLPAGVVFQHVSVSGIGMICTGPAFGTNGAVICNSQVLQPNASFIITIAAQVAPDVPPSLLLNRVSLLALGVSVTAGVQQNSLNNASLRIAKSAPPSGVPGDAIVYNITVSNVGNSAGLNVLVTDVLPPNTSFQSVFMTGGFRDACHFDPVQNALSCSAAFLASGVHEITLVLKTAVSLAGTLTNTVTLGAAVGTVVVGQSSASTSYPPAPIRH